MSVYQRPSNNPFRDYEPRYGTMPRLREAQERQRAQVQRDYNAFMSAHAVAPLDLVCIDGVWQFPSP